MQQEWVLKDLPYKVGSPDEVGRRDRSRGLHRNMPEFSASVEIIRTQKFCQRKMISHDDRICQI